MFSKLIGETKAEQNMYCRNFWLSTLSLISNMFTLFNEVEYNKMANHVEMQFGKTSSLRDVQKSKWIHKLCNHRQLQVDLESELHANNSF